MVYVKINAGFVELNELSVKTNIPSSEIEMYADNGMFANSEYSRPIAGSAESLEILRNSSLS